MTVDMLTAALIWPEEVLIGRTSPTADEDRRVVEKSSSATAPAGHGLAPLWTRVLRRLQANAAAVSAPR